MKIFKGQTEEKFLGNMMLLSSGMFLIITGYYFVAVDHPTVPTYELMTSLMPLEAWGVVMGVSGLLLSAAVFQLGNMRYASMMLGGLIGAVVISLYAMASSEGAANYLVSMRYSMLASFNLLIAVLGGIQAWRIKRLTSHS